MEQTVNEVKTPMTWEEQVQWVIKYTDVELENLYIVEEVYKETTPTVKVVTTIGDKKTVRYE